MRIIFVVAILLLLLSVAGAGACHIKVVKEVISEGDKSAKDPQDFVFTYTVNGNNPRTFILDDDPSSFPPPKRKNLGRYGNTYVITEESVPGWELKDIKCRVTKVYNDDFPSSIDIDEENNRVTITLGRENVVCKFYNEKTPPSVPEFNVMGLTLAMISVVAVLAIKRH